MKSRFLFTIITEREVNNCFSIQALKYRSVTDMSDPFVKLSDVERKPPDILSDQSETEVYCLFDPSVLVSDQIVALSDVNQNV
jgi:hypothetical protein